MWRSHARGWSVDAGYGLLPGKKSSDAVALTAKGLAEAAKIKLMIGED